MDALEQVKFDQLRLELQLESLGLLCTTAFQGGIL